MISAGFPYWVAFFATIVLSFIAGMAIERFVIRPVESAPILTIVIVFIGLVFILNSLAGWTFGHNIQSFPSPFPSEPPFGNSFVSWHELGIVLITFVMVGLLWAFFRLTPLGLALRAAAVNPESAGLCGIKVGSMLALGWGLASAIGAVAGMLIAPVVFLDPNMMGPVLLYAFAAALLGGIDSPVGAVLGGFLLGVTENLVGAYLIGTELKLTVALVIIVGVLVVKPSGLLGKVVVTRV
jgi:branched-chain amino acid transport system permease protein